MLNASEALAMAMQELIDANMAAREVMRRNEERLRRAMKNLEHGFDVQSAIQMARPGAPRQSTNDVLDSYEAARHKLRRVMIGELLAAGMSIGEIGGHWGFSRQLASRYAKEAQASY
ncbi:MAG: hypothetical protein ABSF33_17160 [Acidimicrobiales bacterium]|jgi:hypothetical protein